MASGNARSLGVDQNFPRPQRYEGSVDVHSVFILSFLHADRAGAGAGAGSGGHPGGVYGTTTSKVKTNITKQTMEYDQQLSPTGRVEPREGETFRQSHSVLIAVL